MSDLPLYFPSTASTQVNPAKLVPSIVTKNKVQTSQTSNNPLHFINPHQKKIAKNQKDIKKNYRTKMCPEGRDCKHRFRCNFAHTEQQLRKPFIRRKNPCLLYQRGKCSKGSACRDYHGNIDLKKNYKFKKNICQNFLEGNCEKGEFCINIHPEKEVSQKFQAQVREQAQIEEKDFEQKEINEEKQCLEQKGLINKQSENEEEEVDGVLSITF